MSLSPFDRLRMTTGCFFFVMLSLPKHELVALRQAQDDNGGAFFCHAELVEA
jgi:hypothetical protein